eukprot:CAMPEP_0184018948 /NCGR_PEP_ID=MMETSP0954-20121128/8460_1 /TAXON_ID=627963 /ORGANISM="Aplanochytrium sp, Strain PBS07" /LENGTH=77 /DNA_ID=CAMNT_0026300521 /DNA_START=201 /DNA_END=434 /DNA_ORIENTATION=+
MEEVSEHVYEDDVWVVIYGKVYDVTEWQEDHPGGDLVFLDNAGKDVSQLFRAVGHSPDALALRNNFIVGRLKKTSKL